MLSSPVYDSTSGLILVGNSNGSLFEDPYTLGGNSSYNFVGKAQSVGTAIPAAPIVDSTAEEVFAASYNCSSPILAQYGVAAGSSAGTSSSGWTGTSVTATMGKNMTAPYNGAFDNNYLTSSNQTGYMYFCGNLTGAATPALWRVAITSGTMASTNDGKSFQLVASGNTGTSYDCTPLTEFYNSTQAIDYLFVGVKNSGVPSGCGSSTCVMSFSLPTGYGTPSSSVSFTTGVVAATAIPAGAAGSASNSMSGIIIDNNSSAVGASQIYLGNLFGGTGVQMSQSALH